jgi:hypothetical protein
MLCGYTVSGDVLPFKIITMPETGFRNDLHRLIGVLVSVG